MGFLKTDHSQAEGGFKLLPEGEYEVFPTVYEIGVSQAGNQKVQFNYVVRDDVEQEGQGQQIKFDNFTVTDAAMWRFHAAIKAAGVEDGREFESIEEWAKEFSGSAVRVKVEVEDYTSNRGEKKQKNTIKYFEESQVGGALSPEEAAKYKGGNTPSAPSVGSAAPSDDPFAGNGQPIDIDDSDLPF